MLCVELINKLMKYLDFGFQFAQIIIVHNFFKQKQNFVIPTHLNNLLVLKCITI